MTSTHFDILGAGALPVVVHVPHAGLRILPDVRDGLLLDDPALAEELRLMTDHRTDVLAAGAIEAGIAQAVTASGTTLTEIVGVGPVLAAVIIGPDRSVVRGPVRSPTVAAREPTAQRRHPHRRCQPAVHDTLGRGYLQRRIDEGRLAASQCVPSSASSPT